MCDRGTAGTFHKAPPHWMLRGWQAREGARAISWGQGDDGLSRRAHAVVPSARALDGFAAGWDVTCPGAQGVRSHQVLGAQCNLRSLV